VSPMLADFLFEAVNFLLLAGALGWILFKPVRRALDAERERHEKEDQEAKRLRAEAESLAEEARAARQEVERKLQERRQQMLAAARKEADGLLEGARKRQRDERQALEEELKTTRESQALALADTVGRVAAEAVRQLLEAVSGPSLDEALVRAACTELEGVPAQLRASAVVESAHALDGEARKLLQDTLGPGFEERVVGELGAGVRVTTKGGQVDATAISIARRAARAVSSLAQRPTEERSEEAGRG
jgi:F-type H+-transporting ATPase subunit b